MSTDVSFQTKSSTFNSLCSYAGQAAGAVKDCAVFAVKETALYATSLAFQDPAAAQICLGTINLVQGTATALKTGVYQRGVSLATKACSRLFSSNKASKNSKAARRRSMTLKQKQAQPMAPAPKLQTTQPKLTGKHYAIAVAGTVQAVAGGVMIASGIREFCTRSLGVPQQQFVVVHDNKGAGKPRLGIVSTDGAYCPVTSKGLDGNDYESIAAIPGSDDFVACTSGTTDEVGTVRCHRFNLETSSEGGISTNVKAEFTLPMPNTKSINVEAVAFNELQDGQMQVTYGHRGGIFKGNVDKVWYRTAKFDPNANTLSQIQDHEMDTKAFNPEIRPIADLSIQKGKMLGVAASDPGDNGPFASYVYEHSSVQPDGTFKPTQNIRLTYIPGHKIEAITEDRFGNTIIGTDNEALGSSICVLKDNGDMQCNAIKVPADQAQAYGISGMAPAPKPSLGRRLRNLLPW